MGSWPNSLALSVAAGKENSLDKARSALAAVRLSGLPVGCVDKTHARGALQFLSFPQSKHPADPGVPEA